MTEAVANRDNEIDERSVASAESLIKLSSLPSESETLHR